jgi:hypothetical protein
MATRVEGEQYYKIDGQLAEIKRQLRQKGGYPHDPKKLSGALQACIEGDFPSCQAQTSLSLLSHKAPTQLVRDIFTPIDMQIAIWRQFNQERGWGFVDEDFAAIENSVPDWPDGRLTAVVLVPYLTMHEYDGTDGMWGCVDGDTYTFRELWKAAGEHHNASQMFDVSSYEQLDEKWLHYYGGFKHPAIDKPIMRWEVIDLGRTHETSCNNQNAERPHAGILAAAALHVWWVRSMGGHYVPFIRLPGYKIGKIELAHVLPTSMDWFGAKPTFIQPPM